MEHLALEIFNLTGSGSQFANLPPDGSITVIRNSRIFGEGSIWSYGFKLNVEANVHIFGSAGDLHGARLYEQINKRHARLWVEGLPLHLGRLLLEKEADVDANGDVELTVESGSKIFSDMIDGMSARDVSVKDVIIGVALNRKRGITLAPSGPWRFTLEGLTGYLHDNDGMKGKIDAELYGDGDTNLVTANISTWKTQLWPKLVSSYGPFDSGGLLKDYTNIQTPYDDSHPFCNINICYQKKYYEPGSDGDTEKTTRGYTLRLGRGRDTHLGGDGETRYNNAPNFYLLYWFDRLMEDLGIYIDENQMKEVEDLRRVFMLNFGCFYEEIDTDINVESDSTPADKLERYGEYVFPMHNLFFKADGDKPYRDAYKIMPEEGEYGKVLARNVVVTQNGETVLKISSVPGTLTEATNDITSPSTATAPTGKGYRAYATSMNYPKVDAAEVIKAMETAFGVRLLFSDDYKRVRVILLRNIFRNRRVQKIEGEIIGQPEKSESSIRGFCMTYGQDKENTAFHYKGFDDALKHLGPRWNGGETDKHDYSHWVLNATYAEVLRNINAFNKTCYVTPATGNAYTVKVDKEEAVFFPSILEVAGYMDAEEGDCTARGTEDEERYVETVTVGALPVQMNNVDGKYAVLFSGDMKAPSLPDDSKDDGQKVATPAYADTATLNHTFEDDNIVVTADIDYYIREGYRIKLGDNYDLSGDGESPLDKEEPGLMFGIMRSSGKNATISAWPDTIENEVPDWNYWWEVSPGDGAIDHPDTCDEEGKEWDYDGSETVTTAAEAITKLGTMFPDSNAPFYTAQKGYLTQAAPASISDNNGRMHYVLTADRYSISGEVIAIEDWPRYIETLRGLSPEAMMAADADTQHGGRGIIIEMDSSYERWRTLLQLTDYAYNDDSGDDKGRIILDNGVGSRYGRFSLKLRAEKPNPYYIPGSFHTKHKDKYLKITNPDLRQRGLFDEFYKEYAKFMIEARTARQTVRMELADLLAIDDTVWLEVGDVTGLLSKLQFTVSVKDGLGPTKLELLYI